MLTRSKSSPWLLAMGLVLSALPAQGTFVNFEDAPVKPIAIAAVGAGETQQRFALICNTADNSVEIYGANAPFAYLQRVPVGLSPVTVRWHAATSCFYTCNFLGDSISRVELTLTTGGSPTLQSRLVYTERVPDEPVDIHFLANGTEAFVAHQGAGFVTKRTLLNMIEVERRVLTALPSPVPRFTTNWAVKAPRMLHTGADGRLFVLNFMGGQIGNNSVYDFGLHTGLVADSTGNGAALSNLGSTNFSFAIDASGTRMFVASQVAINDGPTAHGDAAVAALPTGFVQTWLEVVDLGVQPPVRHAEATGATPTAPYPSINLNRDYGVPVPLTARTSNQLAQVTDVVLIPYGEGDVRVAMAANGSDRVVLLTPNTSAPAGWDMQFVDLRNPLTPGVLGAVGPRGLCFDAQGVSGTTTGLLWVQNRLDNTFAVIDPSTATELHRANLQQDPTPAVVDAGRPFLYSARDTSGKGFVSCSSCHVDGRTDTLGWRLGHVGLLDHVPTQLLDQIATDGPPIPADFPADKGVMVTQTLQGLVNSHTNAPQMPWLATNAPYHWRGDKPTFQDFNEAFVVLQGMPPLPGTVVRGIPAASMDQYTAFVETIHHPPNPEQSIDRLTPGSFGTNASLDDGTGAKRGLKLFHIARAVGARSCVDCHSLPEGSNNRLTEVLPQEGSVAPAVADHPIETAATRNIRIREAAIVVPGFLQTPDNAITRTGAFGMQHGGLQNFPSEQRPFRSLSINDFIHRTFDVDFAPAGRTEPVVEFIRQMDTGVAPIIGYVRTFRADGNALDQELVRVENQAKEANAGAVVFAVLPTGIDGYWYDAASDSYRKGVVSLTHAQIRGLFVSASATRLVVQATPSGSERRVAMGGSPAPLAGQPSSIELLPMVPGTPYGGVTDFTFGYTTSPSRGSVIQRLLQTTLQQGGLQYFVNQPTNLLRNEPPRRFRIAGLGIEIGAKLILGMKTNPMTSATIDAEFDLAPTSLTVGGKPVWETAEEVDALQTLLWVYGGYSAPGVANLLAGDTAAPLQIGAPAIWNSYTVRVRNENGLLSPSGVQFPLQVADVR